MAKDSYYFPHDYHSRLDLKMLRLIKDGWENYGIYWAIIEMLHEYGGYLPLEYESISYELRTNYERIKQIIESYDLFVVQGTKFTSQRVLQNLHFREEKSRKTRESIYNRWHKDTNVLRTNYERNTNERKGKEIKEKEIKVYTIFTPPTLAEVVAYKQKTSSIVDPQDFIDFYASKGWKVGTSPMKDWKAAFRRAKNWESNHKKEKKEWNDLNTPKI